MGKSTSVHTTTSEVAADCLLRVVSKAGAFKHLISDNAASFTGKVLPQFCELFDMTKIHISSYSAASNARIEGFHGALSNALKASVTADKECVKMLPLIELSFRSSPVGGLGISPYEIRSGGFSMALPIDMMMLKKFDQEHHTLQSILRI